MDPDTNKDIIRAWCTNNRFHYSQFAIEELAAKVRADNLKVTVIIPSKQVAAQVADVLRLTVQPLVDAKIVTSVVAIDDNSADGTGAVAAAHGARVIQRTTIAPELGPSQGKGDALWRALQVTDGDIVAFIDGDTQDPDPAHLLGIIAPLILYEDIKMVRGCFDRPFLSSTTGEVRAHDGGRVTEILARPLLNLHFPFLAGFRQPLAGEFAGRRELLEKLSFPVGYGVEIGTLIDALRLVGLDSLAEVDLGTRQNCHKALRDLTPMAYAILCTLERRLSRSSCRDQGLFLPWEDNYRDVSCLERMPVVKWKGIKHNGHTTQVTNRVIERAPFLHIDGILNFRMVSTRNCSSGTRKLIYRSAGLNELTTQGKEQLKQLGIAKVFDLRSKIEIEKASFHDSSGNGHSNGHVNGNGHTNHHTNGVEAEHGALGSWEKEYLAWTSPPSAAERIFAPVFPDEDYGPEAMTERFSEYTRDGPEGFAQVYRGMLLKGTTAFRTILLHFAQPSPGPILVHCTAGKDRTGVAVMLLLLLAGRSSSEVATEYALSQDGLASWRPAVLERLMRRPELQGNKAGIENMISAKAENMLAVIEELEKEWGCVEGYVTEHLGLDEGDIERIREALTSA